VIKTYVPKVKRLWSLVTNGASEFLQIMIIEGGNNCVSADRPVVCNFRSGHVIYALEEGGSYCCSVALLQIYVQVWQDYCSRHTMNTVLFHGTVATRPIQRSAGGRVIVQRFPAISTWNRG
jgi:hypothetical protein